MRILVPAGLTVLMAVSLHAQAGSRHDGDLTVTIADQGSGPMDCSSLKVKFARKPATVEEERITVPRGDVLNVTVHDRGGVYVQPSSGGDYVVRLCKAAEEPSGLGDIRAELSGTSLSVKGPAGTDRWVAYLIIDAPADASMKLESRNAPISLKGVRGSFVAKAVNGPISLEDTAGTIDAATQNGPIALSGGEGDVKLRAQNGPVAVELDDEWRGKGLDARTDNGPVALTVSSGFRSGIVVESEDHAPWACDGPACKGWKVEGSVGGRSFRMGDGPAVVRLATSNGPVAIQSSEQ